MEIDNILKHGVNNAVLLLDVVLCRIPFVSYHYQVGLPRQLQQTPFSNPQQLYSVVH